MNISQIFEPIKERKWDVTTLSSLDYLNIGNRSSSLSCIAYLLDSSVHKLLANLETISLDQRREFLNDKFFAHFSFTFYPSINHLLIHEVQNSGEGLEIVSNVLKKSYCLFEGKPGICLTNFSPRADKEFFLNRGFQNGNYLSIREDFPEAFDYLVSNPSFMFKVLK